MGRRRKSTLEFGTFEEVVSRAAERLESGGKLTSEELSLYVQKQIMNHMKFTDALIVHGLVYNFGSAHFGAAEKPDSNTVGVLRDENGRPVLPETPFKGAMRSYLLSVSRRHGIGDAAICKKPVEGGHLDCGTCLACGIMGFMRPKGESFKSRVLVTVGAPRTKPVIYCKAGIVRDPTTNTVRGAEVKATIKERGEEKDGEKKKGEKGAAVFYHKEYVGPSTAMLPIVVRMRGVAVAEAGLVVQALHRALTVDGIGGTLWTPTWHEDPKVWRLTYVPLVGDSELYAGPKAKELLDKLSYTARLAVNKRLFKPYVLAKPLEVIAQ